MHNMPKKAFFWPLAIKKNLDQHHWAKIEVDEVRKSLRWAYDHPVEARQVGLRGQESVWEKWTRESVALSAADRFTEIAKMIIAKLPLKPPSNGLTLVLEKLVKLRLTWKLDKRLSGSSVIDDPFNEVLDLFMRDFVDTWYQDISTVSCFSVIVT
eukprot:sb/3473219/